MRPPGLDWANRVDLALRSGSPLGALGYGVDRWCHPEFDATNMARLVEDARKVADGSARTDDPHLTHPRWVRRLIDGFGGLQLPLAVLGEHLAIESSVLFAYRRGMVAGVPVHQEGHGPGRVLHPGMTVTAAYLLEHDRDPDDPMAWATVAEHATGGGYLPHDYHVPCDAFGTLPRLRRDATPHAGGPPGTTVATRHWGEPRWYGTDIDIHPGQTLMVDARTPWTYGSPRTWTALVVRLIAPGAVLARPARAAPMRSLTGSFSQWNSPTHHLRAGRRAHALT